MYYNILKSIKMPKLPIDYSKTIIYKIICCDLNIKDCYVGHTTDFTRRNKNISRVVIIQIVNVMTTNCIQIFVKKETGITGK